MSRDERYRSYVELKEICDAVNHQMRKSDFRLKGMQIHEVNPVKLGGSPSDLNNKTILTREQHAKVVVWWNRRIREFNSKMGE